MYPRSARSTIVAWILSIAVGVLPATAQERREAEVLLQAAMQKELVEGELEQAIRLYQRILREFAGERPVAAKALLQMGLAYERLGNSEASNVYARLVQDFADQTDAATQARTGLTRIRRGPSPSDDSQGLSLLEVQLQSTQARFALSNDGTRIAFTDRDRDLAIRDLGSGKDIKLVRLAEHPGTKSWPVWSPDDRSIAYVSFHNYWKQEIEIVTVATGQVRHTEVNGLPLTWSRDGRRVLFSHESPDSTASYNLLPVEGGPVQRLAAIKFSGAASLSPDGRYVAYVQEGDGSRDIYIQPVDGGDPVPVTSDAAADADPLWAPSGKFLLFKSSRQLDKWGLWVVPVDGPTPTGPPSLVRHDIGDAKLFSWSRDGKVLFSSEHMVAHVYAATLDPSTQEVRGTPRKLTGATEINRWPAISPDGTRIAYLAYGGPVKSGPVALRVMGIDGRDDREIVGLLKLSISAIDWLNDDEVVVAGKITEQGNPGLHAISTRSGNVRPIFLDPAALGHLAVSPDKRRIAFIYGLQNGRFYTVGVDGKDLRAVTDDVPGYWPSWSPDGRYLALFSSRGPLAIDMQTGERKRLIASEPDRFFGVPAWSPDGTQMIYDSNSRAGDQPALWIASTSGQTPPRRLEIRLFGTAANPNPGQGLESHLSEPRWFPDGSTVVFTAGGYVHKLWIMQNFLPPDPAQHP